MYCIDNTTLKQLQDKIVLTEKDSIKKRNIGRTRILKLFGKLKINYSVLCETLEFISLR